MFTGKVGDSSTVANMKNTFLFWHFAALFLFYKIQTSESFANIHKSLLRKFEASPNGTKLNVFVSMASNSAVVDKFNPMSFQNPEDLRENLQADLKSHASQHQQDITRFLAAKKTPHQSFWITNQIYIPAANKELVDLLSQQFNHIEEIMEEQAIQLEPPIVEKQGAHSRPSEYPTWSIQEINANLVWNSNNLASQGQGIRVANIDTGVRWTHEALKANYLGPYGWFDPYKRKPSRNDTPYDVDCHGTHTMGTIAGSFGIGVAPGAKWMACKACRDDGWCYYSDLFGCFEFVFCPHLPDKSKYDCSKAPHVVNNSWGGGQGDYTFYPIVQILNYVGIISVFAQGNSGPNCGTANSPGDLPNVIGVGATTKGKTLARFSSKGPPVVGKRIKPDISAPGLYVISAFCESDEAYATFSGTSMASPHVAGVVALMQATSGKKKWDFNNIKHALCKQPIRNLTKTGMDCGGVSEDKYPNNSFGCGLVNAVTAVKNIIS